MCFAAHPREQPDRKMVLSGSCIWRYLVSSFQSRSSGPLCALMLSDYAMPTCRHECKQGTRMPSTPRARWPTPRGRSRGSRPRSSAGARRRRRALERSAVRPYSWSSCRGCMQERWALTSPA